MKKNDYSKLSSEKEKIVAIIPARYSSTRLPGKPLKKIDNKYMINMVYERVKEATNIDDVFVATDDERIFSAIEEAGGKAIMTGDLPSGTDRVAEAARKLNLKVNDIVLNVQGDQPLIEPKSLEEVVQPLIDDKSLKMSTIAFKIVKEEEKTNSKDVKVVFDNDNFALYFSRSLIPFCRDNDTKVDIYKHLGTYAFRMDFLQKFTKLKVARLENIEKLEMLRALENGYRIKITVSDTDSPGVDVPGDIERIEAILQKQK